MDINQQLCFKIHCKNSDEIIRLVKEGADINANLCQPLHAAILSNDYDIVKLLIDLGADINYNGGSSILLACDGKQYMIAELLFERGIIVSSDYSGMLTTTCVMNDDVDLFMLFIKYDVIVIFPNTKVFLYDRGVFFQYLLHVPKKSQKI
jgi:hypothetical protein